MNRETQLTNLVATGKLTRLDVDSGTLYVDATNNRVGIGTTTPGSALEVNGTISANDMSAELLLFSQVFS